MTSRVESVASWNDRHTGAMRFRADSGFVVIAGTNAIWRDNEAAAKKLVKAIEPLTDDQLAQALYNELY